MTTNQKSGCAAIFHQLFGTTPKSTKSTRSVTNVPVIEEEDDGPAKNRAINTQKLYIRKILETIHGYGEKGTYEVLLFLIGLCSANKEVLIEIAAQHPHLKVSYDNLIQQAKNDNFIQQYSNE